MSAARRRAPFRVFVTATDTGVGKTEVASALLSLLADRGLRPPRGSGRCPGAAGRGAQ